MGKLTQVDLAKLPGNSSFTIEFCLVVDALIVLGDEVAWANFPETAKNMLGRGLIRNQ